MLLFKTANQRNFRPGAGGYAIGSCISYILCFAGSSIMLLPLAALPQFNHDPGPNFTSPPERIPNPFAWQNYPEALTTIPFLLYFKNTLFILIPTVIGTVVTATLAAYGFARLRWRGRDLVFNILLTTLMLPYAITLIPTFLLWARLGLIQYHLALDPSTVVWRRHFLYLPAATVLSNHSARTG